MSPLGDDDIDAETLQAQLDMSMSIAQGVVSSWLKPKTTVAKRSSALNEAELQEILRRPPRLGVGAPLPESASSATRDTMRLKNKLEDKSKKRSRREEDTEHGSRAESDEEESKAGAIRKKVKVDPFSTPGKKKAKVVAKPLNRMHAVNGQTNGHVANNDTEAAKSTGSSVLSDKLHSSTSPTSHKKEEKRNRKRLDVPEGSLVRDDETSKSDSDVAQTVTVSAESSETARSFPSPDKLSLGTVEGGISGAVLCQTPLTPKGTATQSVGSSAESSPQPSRHTPKAQHPILNLSGPPTGNKLHDFPKNKKRKRNRKKKNKRKGSLVDGEPSAEGGGPDVEAGDEDEK